MEMWQTRGTEKLNLRLIYLNLRFVEKQEALMYI